MSKAISREQKAFGRLNRASTKATAYQPQKDWDRPTKLWRLSSGQSITFTLKYGVWFWTLAPGLAWELVHWGDTDIAIERYCRKNRLSFTEVSNGSLIAS